MVLPAGPDTPGVLPFGRYHLLRPLGRGGMGEVFLAESRGAAGFRKRLVIKRILPELAREPRFVARFLAEGRLVVQLHHPHIVQVLDMGEVDGEIFLAMEYVDGWDLAAVLRTLEARSERMPLDLALVVLIAVAEALAYAHTAVGEDGAPLGIVHRDVSPSNVVIGRQGAVKLLDFGIAAAGRDAGRDGGGGKVAWMSPEQARGEVATAQSDLFSFGIVAHELLTGGHPFRGYSDGQTLERIMEASAVGLSKLQGAGLPPGLVGLVAALLGRDPAARPRDAAEVVRRLREVALGTRSLAGFEELSAWLEPRMGAADGPGGFDVEGLLGIGLGRAMVGGGRDRTVTRLPGGAVLAAVAAPRVEVAEAAPAPEAAGVPEPAEERRTVRRPVLIAWALAGAVAVALGVVAATGTGMTASVPGAEAADTAVLGDAGGVGGSDVQASATSEDVTATSPAVGADAVGPEARGESGAAGVADGVARPADDAVAAAGLTLTDGGDAAAEGEDGGSAVSGPAGGPESLDAGSAATAPALARLRVDVDPPGARVTVAGIGSGRAPFEVEVPVGERVLVRAEAEGREARSQTVVLEGARVLRLVLPVRARGSVSFRVLPADAAVTLDGVAVPVGPTGLVRELALDPGPHTLVATLPDGRAVSRRFDVEAGETVNLRTVVVADGQ